MYSHKVCVVAVVKRSGPHDCPSPLPRIHLTAFSNQAMRYARLVVGLDLSQSELRVVGLLGPGPCAQGFGFRVVLLIGQAKLFHQCCIFQSSTTRYGEWIFVDAVDAHAAAKDVHVVARELAEALVALEDDELLIGRRGARLLINPLLYVFQKLLISFKLDLDMTLIEIGVAKVEQNEAIVAHSCGSVGVLVVLRRHEAAQCEEIAIPDLGGREVVCHYPTAKRRLEDGEQALL